jgi:outer membrane protein OmpA-like peptidoglycan-associated protein
MPPITPPALRRLVAGGALAIASALVPVGAEAQGIGFSLTPSLEEARWGDDLLVTNTIFPGALLSAHFGRFVSLDTHYFRSGALEVEGSATDLVASRWGGDIFVALTPTRLAPFLRFGAGVLEFRPDQDGAEDSRHLAASLGGGLRLQVRDRLSGELSVRRLAFRAGPGSGVVEDDGSGDPVRDIGTYTVGAGLRIPLGGSWNNPETDEAVQNLRTLAVPVRLFGGSIGFADELGLARHSVMGALVGVDLGPFVGTSLYAFGSARDGLKSPEQLYGYGFESSFNLARRGAGMTPHLILGGGRVHFTEDSRAIADFDTRKKWTATVGAGVDFRVTDRFRGEIAARNLLLTQRASADLSSPDQLRSNLLVSAGVRFVIGGGSSASRSTISTRTADVDPLAADSLPDVSPRAIDTLPEVDPPTADSLPDVAPPAADSVDASITTGDELPRTTPEDVEQLGLERDRLIRLLEVERLRQALTLLTEQGDPAEAERLLAEYRGESPGAPGSRTFELPVLEEGEYRIRFGPAGRPDSVSGVPAPEALAPIAPDPRIDQLLDAVGQLEGRLDELAPPAPSAQTTAADSARFEQLLEAFGRLEDRLDEIARNTRSVQTPAADDPQLNRLFEAFDRLEGRIDEITRLGQGAESAAPSNIEVDAWGATGGGDVSTVASEPEARGVFKGEAPSFRGAALYAGGRLQPRSQTVVGAEVDVGSAFGGSLRVRPGLALGFGGDFIWGAGIDLAWPVPFMLGGVQPGLTAGLSLLREDDITRVMIPNIGIELGRAVTDRLEGYLQFQTFDFFDDQRLVLGLRLRPGPEAPRSNVQAAVGGQQAAARTPEVPGARPSETRSQDVPDPERAALTQALEELRSDVGALREELSRVEEAAREAERRTQEARDEAERERARAEADRAEEARTEDLQPPAEVLLEALAPLERLESVQSVRRVALGVAVALGGDRTFSVGQAALSSLAHSEVAVVAEVLLRGDHSISVEGHTDSTGGAELNQRLSEERAASVRAALLAHGLAPSRVTASGFGLTRPVAGNDTAGGRAANRRVEVVVLVEPRP